MLPRNFLATLSTLTILLLASTLTLSAASDDSMWSGLNPQQQGLLLSGKPLVLEEPVEGNAWPRYTVYLIVQSSAKQAAAVFWDCELDPKYVPNCLAVQIVGKPSPWVYEGQYTLKMPFMLPNEVYISRNELKLPSPDVYEISWNVLHAHYIKGSHGNLRIETLPNGNPSGALMRYTNLVMPGSSIAGLLQSQARCQVVESVRALVSQIESELHSLPQLLNHQVEEIDHALGAMPKGTVH
jgi:hypothetical protein